MVKNLNQVLKYLKYNLKNILNWFNINSMRANPGKFQFMILGVDNIPRLNLNFTGKIIPCPSEVVVLGITIDIQI